MEQKKSVIHVDPQIDYTATLPAIFTSAHHSMTINELKAFLFFIGLTQANTPEDEKKNYHEYTFYTSEMASRLQEDLKTKRPRLIYDTFKSLQSKTIEFSDESYKDEEDANRKSFTLFSVVDFQGRKKNKPLTLSLPAELNQFLYESKSLIPFSFDELNQMSSIKAMQVFMYLKTLEARGLNSIPLFQFMLDLELNTKSYMDFKILNNRILKPAEREIRQSTPYKDFSITNDGARGRSPKYLYWQFVVTSIEDSREKRLTLASLKPNVAEKVRSLSKEKQDAVMRALQAGFNASYINKLVAINQDDVVFGANISLAIMQSERNHLSPEETGKMILSAVNKNWVKKDSNKEYLKQKKMAQRVRATQTELDLGITQEIELEANYKRKAAAYFTGMTTEEKKDFFIKKKVFILNVFGHKKEFQIDKYLHRKIDGNPDWRYNEVRAARDVIMSMLKNGDL